MDKNALYKFFEGTASIKEEEAVKHWLESSPEHRQVLLKERKVFDASLLLADERGNEKAHEKKQLYRQSSLRTLVI